MVRIAARGKRRRIAAFAVVGALFLLAAAAAWAATSKRDPALRYSAWSASSAEAQGCLGKRGLYAQLSATVKTRVKPAELRKVADRNRPKEAAVVVSGHRYRLTIDRASSVTGNGQVIWGFKRVPLSAKTAKALIGKKATIQYKIGQARYTSKPVSVEDGRCKSLI